MLSSDSSTGVNNGESTTETALHDLNNDCLLEIFRMLSQDDLLSVYDTCCRFRVLAANAFSLGYSHSTVHLNQWDRHEQKQKKVLQIASLLTKFGTLIVGVQSTPIYRLDHKQILNLILDNCSGTLKSLTLSYFNIESDIIDKLQPLCDNLETLQLDGCKLAKANGRLLPNWNKLVNLDISLVNIESGLFDTFRAQLQSLTLNEDGAGAVVHLPGLSKVERFLKIQNNLRELTISFHRRSEKIRSTGILNTVIDFCCDSLTSLKLSQIEIDSTLTPKVRALFSRLEVLELSCVNLSTDDLFQNCGKLRTLKIQFVHNFNPSTVNADISELQDLEITIYAHEDIGLFCDLLLKCKKLRVLVINIYFGHLDTTRLYKVIQDHLKELSRVEVHQFSCKYMEAIMYIPSAKLSHIKKLSIGNFELSPIIYDTAVFLKSMVSMESIKYLQLANLTVDDRLIEAIAGFSNLQHLKLIDIKPSSPLRLEPLGNLAHLFTLKLVGKWKITDTDLIDVVNKLDNLKALTLILKGFDVECGSYQKLIRVGEMKRFRLVISVFNDDNKFFDPYVNIERDTAN